MNQKKLYDKGKTSKSAQQEEKFLRASTNSNSKHNTQQELKSESIIQSIKSSEFEANDLDYSSKIIVNRDFYKQIVKISSKNDIQQKIYCNFLSQMQMAEKLVFQAIAKGQYEKVVGIFLNFPLPENLKKQKNNSLNNLLHQSVKSGNIFLIEYFMKKNYQLVNQTNNSGKTPLHFCLIYNPHNFKYFIQNWDNKIRWDIKDNLGNTYLHYAYFYNLNIQIRQIMEKKVADCPNQLDMKSFQCLPSHLNNNKQKFKHLKYNKDDNQQKNYQRKKLKILNLQKMYYKFEKIIHNNEQETSNYSISYYQNQGSSITIQDFEILQKLGQGGFTKVFKVKYIPSKKLYALKVFQKFKLDLHTLKYFKNQKNILKKTNHPYLIKMYCSFQNQYFMFLVLELCQGGTLKQRIYNNNEVMKEQQIKIYVSQIVSALSYLHNKNIIHRDLKPQNIALDTLGHVKLIDFGLSKNLKKNVTRTFCGTEQYLPPQVIKCQQYTYTIDWYMLGIIIYEIIYKTTPFRGQYKRDTNTKIIYPFGISQQLQDLLMKLLNCNKQQRIGSKDDGKQIMQHSWFSNINWNSIMKANKINQNYKKKICYIQQIKQLRTLQQYFDKSKITQVDNQFLEINEWNTNLRTL